MADQVLGTTNAKINTLLPKLRDNGSNWVLYKERMWDVLVGQDFRKHLMPGRARPPIAPKLTQSMTDKEKEDAADRYEEAMDNYSRKESAIRAIILSTIPEKTQQRIIHVRPASATWEKLCSLFEKQSIIVQADILAQLFEVRCGEGEDPLKTLDKIVQLSNEYAAAGGKLKDAETAAILIKAIPKDYHSVIHSVMTTAAENGKEVTFEQMSRRLTEAVKLDQTKERREKEEAAAMSAKLKNWKSKKGESNGDKKRTSNKSDVVCYNCEKPGHIAKDCYAEGGGSHKKGKHRGRGKKAKKADSSESSNNSDNDEFAYSAIGVASSFKASGGGKQIRFLDSGASRHFEPDRSNFITIRSCEPYTVEVADGRFEKATEIGEISFQCLQHGRPRTIKLKEVYFTPWMNNGLISLTQLRKSGLYFSNKTKGFAVLTDVDSGREILRVKETHNMYPIESWKPGSAMKTNEKQNTLTVMEAHARMGHIAPSAIRKLTRDAMVTGLNVDLNSPDEECEACIKGKLRKLDIPKCHPSLRSSAPWDLVWSDVWGPPDVEAKGGYKYYVSFTDDYTRYSRIYLMRQKSEVLNHYRSFAAWVRTQFKSEIKTFHSDRGGEFRSDDFDKFLAEHGTKRSLTAHDTPEMNGVAERLNLTLVDHSRAMLCASGMPKNMWAYSVYYALWVKNRLPTKFLESAKKTPYEMLWGAKPDLSKARGFGCKVFVKSKTKSKLEEKANPARWIGLSEDTKGGHLVYWPEKNTISVERNVRFLDGTTFVGEDDIVVTTTVPLRNDQNSQGNEAKKPGHGSPLANPSDTNPESVHQTNCPRIDARPSPQTIEHNPEVSSDSNNPLARNDNSIPEGRPQRTRQPSAYVRRLLEHGNELPRGMRQFSTASLPSDTQGPSQVDPSPGLKSSDAGVGAFAHGFAMNTVTYESDGVIVPQSRKEAMGSTQKEQWLEAEGAEQLSLIANRTFGKLLPRTEAKTTPLPLRWVYDVKRDENGNNIGYKARVVVRGDKQEKFLNYNETFSSVLKSTSRNILLAVAAQNDWHIRQSDFKSAYLNAELNEDIYVEQPPGYEIPGKEDYVFKLHKALYGLKQAAHLWFLAISGFLTDVMGFTQSKSDPAVFFRYRDGKEVILGLHVDDDLLIGNDLKECLEVEEELNAQFPMKAMGDAHLYLGITIERDREARTVSLGQSNYIDALVSLCGLEDAKTTSTPLPLGVKLGKEFCPSHPSDIADMSKVPYRQVVGGLIYLASKTRLDVAYAASVLGQVASNPGRVHWEAVKYCVRYLKGTRDNRLTFGHGPPGLYGFSDASHASPDLGWKSMSGYVFIINGGAISWSAKKQSVVALSTAESEYIAMTHATKELLWIKSFISEVFRPLNNPIHLFADNQSAIAMAKHDSFHPRAKHIALPYHFIRHHVAHNHLTISWIDTHSNCADLFTKVLDRKKISNFARNLGLLSA
jgi:transposase InsO family protein